MNIYVVLSLLIVVCCTLLGCQPFDKKREFAGWAKMAFGIIAFVGITVGLVGFARSLNWIALSAEGIRRLDLWLSLGRGIILGVVITLMLSRQFLGTKKTAQSAEKATAPLQTPASVPPAAAASVAPPPGAGGCP